MKKILLVLLMMVLMMSVVSAWNVTWSSADWINQANTYDGNYSSYGDYTVPANMYFNISNIDGWESLNITLSSIHNFVMSGSTAYYYYNFDNTSWVLLDTIMTQSSTIENNSYVVESGGISNNQSRFQLNTTGDVGSMRIYEVNISEVTAPAIVVCDSSLSSMPCTVGSSANLDVVAGNYSAIEVYFNVSSRNLNFNSGEYHLSNGNFTFNGGVDRVTVSGNENTTVENISFYFNVDAYARVNGKTVDFVVYNNDLFDIQVLIGTLNEQVSYNNVAVNGSFELGRTHIIPVTTAHNTIIVNLSENSFLNETATLGYTNLNNGTDITKWDYLYQDGVLLTEGVDYDVFYQGFTTTTIGTYIPAVGNFTIYPSELSVPSVPTGGLSQRLFVIPTDDVESVEDVPLVTGEVVLVGDGVEGFNLIGRAKGFFLSLWDMFLGVFR